MLPSCSRSERRSAPSRVCLAVLCCAFNAACEEPLAQYEDGGPAVLALHDAGRGEAGPGSVPVLDAGATPEASVSAWDASVSSDVQGWPQASPASAGEIVDHARWVRLDANLDPFQDRPERVVCEPGATLPELFSGASAYGVETAFCNYATLHQSTLRRIVVGESITVRLAHYQLEATEASEAHLVVRVDDLAILDEHIPIPAPSQVLVRRLAAPRDIPVGSNVYFHVHNHGANSYALISVSAGP